VAAYYLPNTPNGRGVAAAWQSAGTGRATQIPVGEIGGLIISGDEALADPRVLGLAERARFVLTTSMFMSEVTGQSHLVLPGTSYLERDGTTVNLEGRPQRQRRAVQPSGWDELEFFARLAARFGIELDGWAHPAIEDRAPFPLPLEGEAVPEGAPVAKPVPAPEGQLTLLRYRALFSGPGVERVPQLAFQRPEAEIELAASDAKQRGIAAGDPVHVSSNGTARTLRAKLNRRLLPGVVRLAAEHAVGLGNSVEIARGEE
jgi:predicted molibdopterin-dependent oxidoreductase YjgC